MLVGFEGTVIFVSHDRFFVDRVANRVWQFADGALTQYLGNYTDAHRQQTRQTAASAPAKPVPEPPRPAAVEPDGARSRTSSSDSRLKKRLTAAETAIGRLEGRLNELSDAITIASIDGDTESLARLGESYAAAQGELDDAYASWEELNAQLEAANIGASVS